MKKLLTSSQTTLQKTKMVLGGFVLLGFVHFIFNVYNPMIVNSPFLCTYLWFSPGCPFL